MNSRRDWEVDSLLIKEIALPKQVGHQRPPGADRVVRIFVPPFARGTAVITLDWFHALPLVGIAQYAVEELICPFDLRAVRRLVAAEDEFEQMHNRLADTL